MRKNHGKEMGLGIFLPRDWEIVRREITIKISANFFSAIRINKFSNDSDSLGNVAIIFMTIR